MRLALLAHDDRPILELTPEQFVDRLIELIWPLLPDDKGGRSRKQLAGVIAQAAREVQEEFRCRSVEV